METDKHVFVSLSHSTVCLLVIFLDQILNIIDGSCGFRDLELPLIVLYRIERFDD